MVLRLNVNGKFNQQWQLIFFSKDSEESRIMHTKSDDIEIMIGNETNEIIEKLFDCLLQRYQKVLEDSMRGGEFIFDGVDL